MARAAKIHELNSALQKVPSALADSLDYHKSDIPAFEPGDLEEQAPVETARAAKSYDSLINLFVHIRNNLFVHIPNNLFVHIPNNTVV